MNYKTLFSGFSGKTVFVTGHTGFKGAWITAILTELGAKVIGYSSPNSNDLLFNSLGLSERITHIEGDICDYNHLQRSINRAASAFAADLPIWHSMLNPTNIHLFFDII